MMSMMLLAGCGGGGGGGGGGTGSQQTISGSVLTPNGGTTRVAQREAAALTNVSSIVTVFVYSIAGSGAETLITSNATDSSGNFSITLPAGVTYTTSLLVLKTTINSVTMRGFVTSTTNVIVSPLTEAAVSVIEDEISSTGASYNGLTVAEIANIQSKVNTANAGTAFNGTILQATNAAYATAAADPNVQSAVQSAVTGDFFLIVSAPLNDNQIYYTNTLTVSGRTSASARIQVNGANVTVDSSGSFSLSNVSISSNPTAITVDAYLGTAHYQVKRNVYYDNKAYCNVVYIASDPRTGYNRVFTADPSIPNSSRLVYDDLPGYSHSSVALSPDRTQVAFVRGDSSGNQNVVKAACSGAGSLTSLTSATGVHYKGISWAHSGATLAYASDAPGQYDIYTLSSSGGTPTRITTHSAQDDAPSWLQSDTGLIFSSYRNTDGGAGVGSYSNLWKVYFSNVSVQELVYDPLGQSAPACAAGAGKCYAKNPDVSAAGTIIFQFDSGCQTSGQGQTPPQSVCSNLFVMSSISGTPTQVTSGSNYYISPRWNEAGTAVVFINVGLTDQKIMKLPFSGASPGTSVDLSLTGTQADY